MNAGLLGAGTIGFGVCEISAGIPDLEIAKVLDRREIPGLEGRLTKDIGDIMQDNGIGAVIELLGGVEPAHSWAIQAMRAGKSFVTANKLMVSENLPELLRVARENGVSIRFSAAVGGGIPYLFNLLRARRVDNITEVGGILNGTTNYMLDLMQSQGIGFSEALKLAQEAGYAEADPTADISGGDAKCKIMLSSCVAWDGLVNKPDILCEGIEAITARDMAFIKEKGYACKLLARSAKVDGGICCYVEPTLAPKDSVMANIALVENMAFFRGENAGLQRFTGAGAGRYATAYAVVNDLIDIERNADAYAFSISERPIAIDNAAECHRYVARGIDVAGAEELGGGMFITPEISVSEMHALARAAREAGGKPFFAGIME